ncbi:MAG: hypothetical protein MR592_08270, partial [Prevotella sp.]|nr:hypothetical protein [Prevotella sp.]
RQKRDEVPEGTLSCPDRNLAFFHHYRHYEGLRLLPSVCDSKLIQQTLIMFSTQFWLIVIGFAKMMGCCWIFNMFQKRAYKREIRSRHSYVLLAKLLAEEERLGRNISKCNEDGTGEVYLGLPEGIVKVFSLGNDRFAISLVGAVIVNDLHADMARELCKDLNTKESRVRYSVGYEPAFTKTGISITCDLEDDADDETTEYNILAYTKDYLVPKQQELQTLWKRKMEELQQQ